MKVSAELLVARLKAQLQPGIVDTDAKLLAPYVVDGLSPTVLCSPDQVEQVSVALRVCAETGATVVPWGGGTSIGLGNVPPKVDLVLDLAHLDAVIEHDDANLTATVQAGTKVAVLQEVLGRKGQFLALDPPYPSRATVGGVVATNVNGPRRVFYGGVRDLVIGMKVVLATGEQIKAGGKVVKNVAGYDMCKLFVGSLGTLGIITEVTFRMTPIPESAATILGRGPLDASLQFIDQLSQSVFLPAGTALLSGEVARVAGMSSGNVPAIAIWVEGFKEPVGRHLREIQTIAERFGLGSEILTDRPHQRLWDIVRDFASTGEGLLYRVTTPLAAIGELVNRIESSKCPGSSARYIAHPSSGSLWLSVDADPSGAAWFARLTGWAEEHRGHAVMVAAPPEIKNGVNVWGPPPPGISIMRELKRQFDPEGILNRGRFVSGL
ncbi:MAG: FAD-binding oxidoreductase [Deltaproteobacteria bacterium]|nr:FAD-binding oxidoreductase [Deltaproteobacteria bacterium]